MAPGRSEPFSERQWVLVAEAQGTATFPRSLAAGIPLPGLGDSQGEQLGPNSQIFLS